MYTDRTTETGNGDSKSCGCPDDLMTSPDSSLCGTCRGIKLAAMYYEIHNKKEKERADSEAKSYSTGSRSYLDSIVQNHTPKSFQQQQHHQPQYAGAGSSGYGSSTSYQQTSISTGYQYAGTATSSYHDNSSYRTPAPAAYGGNNQYYTSTDQGNANYSSTYNTQGSYNNDSSEQRRDRTKHVHFQDDGRGQN